MTHTPSCGKEKETDMERNSSESEIVRSKLPCDECGSSDAVAEYDDGHTYCFSCNHYERGEGGRQSMSNQVSYKPLDLALERLQRAWADAKPSSIPQRSLSSGNVGCYGVVVGDNTHAYPYFKDGDTMPCAFKVRNVDNKTFRVVGELKGAGLFGENKYGNHQRNRIVITEDELEAIPANQTFGGQVPVVALKGGPAAAGEGPQEPLTFLAGIEASGLCCEANDTESAGTDTDAD